MSTAKFGEYTQVEKLDLTSKDILSDNIAKIGQLFPEVLTESSDENGRLRPAIDFDKLRQFLSREIVEGRESYEFTWVGKRGAIAEAGKPTTQTLRPDLEESVDFDKSENVFITGDNLEVLKVLQESYLGKIDMIYIDPPYNTGKDFVYSDKFQMSEEELADEMDLRDENGLQRVGLTKNEKSSARYHSDWLNMMYPRLVLARNLLKDSGVIFISIDDNEQANLKAICDEIFGEENFVGTFIRRTINSGKQDSTKVSDYHEYCLSYSKSITKCILNRRKKSETERQKLYPLEDEYVNTRGRYYISQLDKGSLQYSDGLNFAIKAPDGTDIWPGEGFHDKSKIFRWSKDKVKWGIDNDYLVFKKQGNKWKVYAKSYEFRDNNDNVIVPSNPYTTLDHVQKEFSNFNATPELNKLFGNKKYFDFPKPVPFIMDLIKYAMQKESIILDFFAGSATTADAVMQLNAEDGGNRKYILCTLDEQLADKSAAKEAGYETIDQISRERIRRAAKKIQEEHPETVGKQDFGFRAYKLDTSNFKDVSQTPDSFSQESLFDSVSNIKDGRTDLDLLFQIMLTWGMELSLPIAKTQIDGTAVYNVADGALIACFADEISESVLRQIAKEEPLRAVFKDESFANSAAKINLGQIFKEEAPNTKVKVV
ncbi:TPA: site-specific DNA-methyltransferase [Streptococcus suis]|nr:site-specific DNA-methyltransferase [Streptococcus suis]